MTCHWRISGIRRGVFRLTLVRQCRIFFMCTQSLKRRFIQRRRNRFYLRKSVTLLPYTYQKTQKLELSCVVQVVSAKCGGHLKVAERVAGSA